MTYNIGGFNEWKTIDIIKAVDRLLGRPVVAELNLITYVTACLGTIYAKPYALAICKDVVVESQTSQFEQGIEKTVKWYIDKQEWMDNMPSKN